MLDQGVVFGPRDRQHATVADFLRKGVFIPIGTLIARGLVPGAFDMVCYGESIRDAGILFIVEVPGFAIWGGNQHGGFAEVGAEGLSRFAVGAGEGIGPCNADGFPGGPIGRGIAFVFEQGVVVAINVLNAYVNSGHIPIKEFLGRLGEGLQIFGESIDGALSGPIRFWEVRLPEVVGGVPGEHVLFAGLVKEKLRCSYGQNDSGVIGNRFEIRLIVAVLGPGDEVFGDPEVDGGAIIACVASDVVAAIVSFADAGVTMIGVENAFALVEIIPV